MIKKMILKCHCFKTKPKKQDHSAVLKIGLKNDETIIISDITTFFFINII